jgi:hypothetical protein
MRTGTVVVLTAVLLTATVAPGIVGATHARAQTTDARAPPGYAGSHVSFETTSNAVTNYSVDGEQMFASMKTESRSSYESRTSVAVGADLELADVTDLRAAAVSVGARTRTSSSVRSESGANITAHDNARGILTVRSQGDSAQIVKAEISASAQAEAASEDRVVVTAEDGQHGTFIVVGNGSVTVNEEGDVIADLEDDATLVFRAYVDGERDEDAKSQERLIANGEAAAEIYATEQNGTQVVDAVTYTQNTTVSAKQRAGDEVQVTVERARHDGKVVITHVSEAAVGATENLSVTVDGEAAARASSYSDLEAAADNGSTSKYMVRQSSDAEASAEVLVAVNHFSERTITMRGDGSNGSDGTDASDGGDSGDDPVPVGSPGLGVGAAVAALAGTALLGRYRA